MSTGMPAGIWLGKFGMIVKHFFGHTAYQVGSSLHTKAWRDVDVRLILPDDEFTAMFGTNQNAETNPRLSSVTLAYAALGHAMTGLPIDFQIQPQSWANEHYPGPRSALIEVEEQERLAGPVGPRDVSWLRETHWKMLEINARLHGWGVLRPEEKALPDSPARISAHDCDRIVGAAVAQVRAQIQKWAEPADA